MKIIKTGTLPTVRANADWFTGTVWQDPVIDPPEPARARATKVSFEPGARTAWHTHPLGQTLHVLSGVGWVQLLGEPKQTITAGDTVWIAPEEKHWHGATDKTGMVHLAIHEALDNVHVNWMEQVTDADYLKD